MHNATTQRTALALAISGGLLLCSGQIQAAALERSGHDVSAFFEKGLYAEAVYTHIDAKVTGEDKGSPLSNNQPQTINDIAKGEGYFRYAVKTDINDTFSLGVLYDEPWGASASYHGVNNFVNPDGKAVQALQQGAKNSLTQDVLTSAAITISFTPASKFSSTLLHPTATSGTRKETFEAVKSTLQFATQIPEYSEAYKSILQKFNQKVSTGQNFKLNDSIFTKEEQELIKTTLKDIAKAKVQSSLAGRAVFNNLIPEQATQVTVHSKNITALLGAKFGANKNFQLYAGPAFQQVSGNVALRGVAYNATTGYNAKISSSDAVGWVAGAAFHKPEIALRAAFTYRSPIKHKANIAEELPFINSMLGGSLVDDLSVPDPAKNLIKQEVVKKFSNISNVDNKVDIKTPETYSLDFQTGVNPTTLVSAKVRYVPWSKFTITPPKYNALTKISTKDDKGLPLVSYDKDQWYAEFGVGKRINKALALSGNVSWDSGAGNPTSSLGPVKGYYGLGLGAKYNLTDKVAISAGGKYLWFGNAKGALPNGEIVSDFKDNTGYAVGLKLSYQEK